MAALNIQIEVPNMGVHEIEKLKQKITAYAQKLVSSSSIETSITNKTKRYKHESMAGIFSSQQDVNDLRDTYINEKYGL